MATGSGGSSPTAARRRLVSAATWPGSLMLRPNRMTPPSRRSRMRSSSSDRPSAPSKPPPIRPPAEASAIRSASPLPDAKSFAPGRVRQALGLPHSIEKGHGFDQIQILVDEQADEDTLTGERAPFLVAKVLGQAGRDQRGQISK